MDKITFPILEEKENELISIDGHGSLFFKIKSPDLEQLSDFQKKEFFNTLGTDLERLGNGDYLKLYCVEEKSYLQMSQESSLSFSSFNISPQSNPLGLFFGSKKIFSDIGIYDDYLSYNGQYVRIFSAQEFSGQGFLGMIPRGVDYVLNIKKISKEESIKKLERIRTGHLSSFLKRKRDIEGEGSYEQAEKLLEEVLFEKEALFSIELFFILKSFCLEELYKKSFGLESDLKSRGIKIFAEGQSLVQFKTGLAHLFTELIPGVFPKLALREHWDKTSHLAYLLPLNPSYLMDKGVLFHDQAQGEIFFNLFDRSLKNRNMLVSGTTGAGKSVFVNKLLHHLECPNVILDKGGSFKKISLYHDAKILSPPFNPLQFKDPVYLREFILSVTGSKSFGRLKRAELLKEITKSLPGVFSFWDLLEHLEGSFPKISFYFEELKDFIGEDQTPIKSMLYVDVEDYPKVAVAPVVIFALQYFKSIQQKNKLLVIDECWSFLKAHSLYIEECFRTFRKTGASSIAIAQGVGDFLNLDGKISKAIINTSYFQVLFPQDFVNEERFSEFDKERLKSLHFEKNVFSDCYLKSSDGVYQKIIRNFLTPLEFELFHTESGEDEKLFRFVENTQNYFKSIKDSINAYVRLKYDKDQDIFPFLTSSGKDSSQ